MPVIPQSIVTVSPRFGEQETLVDGVSVEANASGEEHIAYTITEDLHLDEIILIWKDFDAGDKGWLRLIHPSSQGFPAAVTGADVDVGALSPYYNGAIAIEFWNAAGTILEEVIPILSISGTVITLANAPDGSYTAANAIKARLQNFHPIRGTRGIDSGFRFLGSGNHSLGATLEQTNAIPAGLLFYVGIKVGAGGIQRHFATNFVFRKPLP